MKLILISLGSGAFVLGVISIFNDHGSMDFVLLPFGLGEASSQESQRRRLLPAPVEDQMDGIGFADHLHKVAEELNFDEDPTFTLNGSLMQGEEYLPSVDITLHYKGQTSDKPINKWADLDSKFLNDPAYKEKLAKFEALSEAEQKKEFSQHYGRVLRPLLKEKLIALREAQDYAIIRFAEHLKKVVDELGFEMQSFPQHQMVEIGFAQHLKKVAEELNFDEVPTFTLADWAFITDKDPRKDHLPTVIITLHYKGQKTDINKWVDLDSKLLNDPVYKKDLDEFETLSEAQRKEKFPHLYERVLRPLLKEKLIALRQKVPAPVEDISYFVEQMTEVGFAQHLNKVAAELNFDEVPTFTFAGTVIENPFSVTITCTLAYKGQTVLIEKLSDFGSQVYNTYLKEVEAMQNLPKADQQREQARLFGLVLQPLLRERLIELRNKSRVGKDVLGNLLALMH